jgi:quinoprotein glucose dehydrogenase
VQPPKEVSDIDYIMGTAGQTPRLILGGGEGGAADAPAPRGGGRGGSLEPPAAGGRGGRGGAAGAPALPPVQRGGTTVQGLSILKPPYGVLSAVNLDRGELSWQVPHGETPDNVRNHPALKGLNISRTGQSGSVGLTVTRTLVILGDPQVTAPPGRPRGAMLRAYDKQTGQEVGAVWMPAGQSGSPMTYMANGRQYIIVAVSGGNYSGEYIAFALPDAEVRPTNQAQ